MNNNLPNFLIVGTAKAATTTIHEYLKQHPKVFMTEWKEPCFFVFKDQQNLNFKSTKRIVKFITRLEDYKEIFENGKSKEIRGESSTPYLYFYDRTIENIRNTIPNHKDTKILIVLRNPVDRAYSQYMMKIRDLEEKLTFNEALDAEEDRMQNNFHFDFFYKDRGLYSNQVKAYLEEFNNVKVILYEDFKSDTNKILGDIVDFLNLEKFNFQPINRLNASGKPKNKIISRILIGDNFIKRSLKPFLTKRLRNNLLNQIQKKNLKQTKIDNYSKAKLQEFFKSDVKKLETLIDRDLKEWYS
ncbi:sulfotransferase [Winogradskyella aquimaris]|uniref:Sulfotransferase n=1 Tax=Winogradskyella aquimaris TaxID=864074 RepID=A0ABU5EJL8_9FLAO|nr:sulfotransferase [Winogradskyella aquimaris]MDY2586482.1 sulfotransferase [Winogradskyella aquimaris]